MPRKPTRKYTKKTYAKKKYVSKRRPYTYNYATKDTVAYFGTMSRSLPMPPKFRTKLTISNTGQIGGAVSLTGSTYIIRLNGIYLPFNTSSVLPGLTLAANATQPSQLGFFLSTQNYTRYRVYKASCRVRYVPSSLLDQMLVSLQAAENGLSPTTTQSMAQPFQKERVFTQAENTKELMMTVTMAELSGVTEKTIQVQTDANFTGGGATLSTLPTDSYDWYISSKSLTSSTSTSAIGITITCDYWVEFFEPAVGAFLET